MQSRALSCFQLSLRNITEYVANLIAEILHVHLRIYLKHLQHFPCEESSILHIYVNIFNERKNFKGKILKEKF